MRFPRIGLIAGLWLLALAGYAHAVNLKNPGGWLKEDKKRECVDLHQAVRAYFEGGYTSGDDLVVSYCNQGAYIIKNTRLTIVRERDNAKVYDERLHQNLTRGWGHVFFVNLGGVGNKGETFKLELQYNIATGDKKRCKQSFQFKVKDAVWMVKSEGAKFHGNGCEEIKFATK